MKILQIVQRVGGVVALVAALCTVPVAQAAYVVGGAAESLIRDSDRWAWDGSYMAGFRGALENPANFGPGGIVNRSISTVTLSEVNAGTLAGVNMFVGTWISDIDAAPISAAVKSFFLGGGDLFLLQDDSGHDALGAALGIATTASTGGVSNGGAPLYNGPFGIAVNVAQLYNVGKLDPAAIAILGGHIGGVNVDGEITSAFWKAGEFAPGAGALFVVADIDMIATTTACGLPLCGASYNPLNDNGIYALNTFSFLQQNGGNPVPEPGTLALLGLGLLAVTASRRQKAKRG